MDRRSVRQVNTRREGRHVSKPLISDELEEAVIERGQRRRPCSRRLVIRTRFILCWMGVLLLAGASITAHAAGLPKSSANGAEVIRVAGLNQSVEILRDRWGINHIY